METKLAEIDPSTSAFKILVYLTFKDQPMKPIEIAKGLGENGSTVRARLAELNKTGLVDNTNEGYVSLLTSYDILMKLYKP
ncbi:MAG: helix-turn-helix domain-containing protein [Candidatus Bathyarchaeota archaeon]